jgi:hypothetical protein
MTMSAAVDVTTIPRINHGEAMRIAAVENRRFAAACRARESSATRCRSSADPLV